MKIAVVVSAYNRLGHLPATLESVLAQTRPADEVVVVDDASSEDVMAVAAHYAAAGVRCVRRPVNGGISAARATGQAETTGEALLFLDSDDLLLPCALAALEAALEARPDAALAFCRAQIIDGEGRVTRPLWKSEDDPEDIWARLTAVNRIRSTGAVLLRRAHLEAVGGWDESLRASEDWDLWLRLAEVAPFVRVSEPLLQYRVHGANMSADASLMRHTEVAVFRKALERYRRAGDRDRYAVVWRHYVAALPPDEAGLAAEEACRALGEGSRAEVWAHARRAAAHSRRHRLLRGLIEGSGVAALYRRTPLRLRLRMRSLFGVRADAN